MSKIITEANQLKRYFIRVKGIVQGVGFRPFIYSLALKYQLSGYVLNDTSGVRMEIEGPEGHLNSFLRQIKNNAPPLTIIETIERKELPLSGYRQFQIKKSREERNKFIPLSPDISLCPDCLRELLDRDNRRFEYPFINCTNCGPRFTITQDIPYDRSRTTMKNFRMCTDCQDEYDNPADRRFHAQPNACPVCGPQIELYQNGRKEIITSQPLEETVHLLREGKIVAVKGLGGFHLACDATNVSAVKKLRKRKYREDKPFAIMVPNLESVKSFCPISPEEEKLLTSPRRPILLLSKKADCSLPREIAPHHKYLGVMLPYTPLHYLLLRKIERPLIMTSGNVSDEPIVYKNKEAFSRLGKIADFFLIHNRKIHLRCDDSVTRIFRGQEIIIRRSRGYVPQPLKLKVFFEPHILAVGGHLKNTFCLARENYAFLSHHIGDLENLSALISLEEGIKHFLKVFHSQPRIVACDLHPDYLSSKFAQEYVRARKGTRLISVQHHHAHIVSLLAEQGLLNEKVIGVAFDGSGLGDDNTIWGGEFLVADLMQYFRIAHLKYIPLPGGEKAIKEPWRMAVSYLYRIYGEKCLPLAQHLLYGVEHKHIGLLIKVIKGKINTPLTSSMGRLFDAVSALMGLRKKINYLGQAAVELEMISREGEEGVYSFDILELPNKLIIDPDPMIVDIVSDLDKKISKEIISARFHNTIAHMILKVSRKIQDRTGLRKVALSGGVFQNIYLLEKVCPWLKKEGFQVYLHSRVPANDGGISLGQALIAHFRKEK